MKKNLWIFLIGAPLFALLLASIRVYYAVQIWEYQGPEIVFEVKLGEGFSSINYRLAKDKIISNSRIFHRYAQINGIMTKFKAGKFLIPSNSSMADVIDILTKGVPIATKVTIPEGKNLFEIGKILEEAGITTYKEFVRAAKDRSFMQELGIPASRAEGYLYPDTYQFQEQTPAKQVIKAMYSHFQNKTESFDFERSPLNKHQVIILASIVEKETGAKHERPTIAGVFHNRLKKRMRLQSDPTTIYGIYETFNGNLRKKHLLEKTPYNTYKISALPKGPICNPGTEAINAVLNPESHKYLYFVSKNDGTHIFSETYRQHRQAVEKWQKTQSNRVGKSWRDLQQ